MPSPAADVSFSRDDEPAVDAIVAAWCIEGDASVLLPQLRQRLHSPTLTAEETAVATGGALHSDRIDAAIAKRLAAAMLRKIRAEPVSGAPAPSLVPSLVQEVFAAAGKHSSSALFAVVEVGDTALFPPPPQPVNDVTSASELSATAGVFTPPAAPQSARPHEASSLMASGESDWVIGGGLATIDLHHCPTTEANQQSLTPTGPGGTMSPRSLSSSVGFSEAKVRKELARALTDVCQALLLTSRQRVSMSKELAAAVARNQEMASELEAANATAARLEMQRFDDLQRSQWHRRVRRSTSASDGVLDQQQHPACFSATSVAGAESLSRRQSRRVSLAALSVRASPPELFSVVAPSAAVNFRLRLPDADPRGGGVSSPPERSTPRGHASMEAAVVVSPRDRSTLSAKGSGVFPSSLLPVRMQQRAEESIDEIGMPMLNQYVILSELGAGCQGTVKLALDTETEELRAIKVIARPTATSGIGLRKRRENASKRAQLQREIAIMKRCRHRNVVALYEVIDDPEADSMYLVMQYVEKGSVAKQAENGETTPIDGAILASYAKQLCSGLHYLHSRGIVHRDIKPENILLGSNDTVFLADFGISSIDDGSSRCPTDAVQQSPPPRWPHRFSVTLETPDVGNAPTPTMCGTMAFLAPETSITARAPPVESDAEIDAIPAAAARCAELARGPGGGGCAADVWALGMSLYVMLYGQLPWPPTRSADYMDHVTSAPIPYPTTTRNGHCITKHEEWCALLRKMLCRDLWRRATAADIHEAASALEREYQIAEQAVTPAIADDELQHALTVVRRCSHAPSTVAHLEARCARHEYQPPRDLIT